MADLIKSMEMLSFVEHNNNSSEVLHKNKGETGLTFFGIYQTAHPTLSIWNTINSYLKIEPDLKKCGKALVNNREIMQIVYSFYKREFWDKMKLDLVNSQKIADEMFIFGVNTHWKTSAKAAQTIIGFNGNDVDGFIGSKSLERLNKFDEKMFDIEFDKYEILHYEDICRRKPHLKVNLKGWKNRAYFVEYKNQNIDFGVYA